MRSRRRSARASVHFFRGEFFFGATLILIRSAARPTKGGPPELNELAADEFFVYAISVFASIATTLIFYSALFRTNPLARGRTSFVPLALTPPVCLLSLLPFLFHLTAREVREDQGYVRLFLFVAVPLLLLATKISELLGVSLRDDALERRNPAAVVTLCGAWLGVTAIYAGANVGEGATIWTTFGPALLGVLTWAALWSIVERLTTISDAIAIDRDVRTAARLAAYLVLSGVILGWAVAGDYVSATATLDDFAHRAWPAAVAAGVLVIAHYAFRKKIRLPA